MQVKDTFGDISQEQVGDHYQAIRGRLIKTYKQREGTTSGHKWTLQGGIIESLKDGSQMGVKFVNQNPVDDFWKKEVFIFSGEKSKNGDIKVVDEGEKWGLKLQVAKGAMISEDAGTGDSVPNTPSTQSNESAAVEFFYVDFKDGKDEVQFSRTEIIETLKSDPKADIGIWDHESEEWKTPIEMGLQTPPPPPQKASPPPTPPTPPAANQNPPPPSYSDEAGPDGHPDEQERYSSTTLPSGVTVTRISYRETQQVKQFEPVSIEMEATLTDRKQIAGTLSYLKTAVRYAIDLAKEDA